jgi:nicotinamidase-related amidase
VSGPDPQRPSVALLILDLQNQFAREFAHIESFDSTIEHIEHVARIMRGAGQPVVFIKDIESIPEDSVDAAVIPALSIAPSDIVMTKVHSNAFWQTDLEAELRTRDVGLVVVSGFAAEHCVLATYGGAQERGFRVALLQNGLASEDPEVIRVAMRHRHVVSYPVLEFILGHGAEPE